MNDAKVDKFSLPCIAAGLLAGNLFVCSRCYDKVQGF
jgi:hypothetical protein